MESFLNRQNSAISYVGGHTLLGKLHRTAHGKSIHHTGCVEGCCLEKGGSGFNYSGDDLFPSRGREMRSYYSLL